AHRGQPLVAGRIGGRAAAHEQHERDNRHLRVPDAPDAEAVREPGLVDARKREASRSTGLGEPVPRNGHDTTASAEPGAASTSRPFGTMLSVTRRAGSR